MANYRSNSSTKVRVGYVTCRIVVATFDQSLYFSND